MGIYLATGANAVTVANGVGDTIVVAENEERIMAEIQLPQGASLNRTEDVTRHVEEIVKADPAIEWILTVPGCSILDGAIEPNAAFVLGRLKPFDERATPVLKVVFQRLREWFHGSAANRKSAPKAPAEVEGLIGRSRPYFARKPSRCAKFDPGQSPESDVDYPTTLWI